MIKNGFDIKCEGNNLGRLYLCARMQRLNFLKFYVAVQMKRY